VKNLDLQKVARAFGFTVPPRVTLNVKLSGKTVRKNKIVNLIGDKKKYFVRNLS
jgi:hypothetical protein